MFLLPTVTLIAVVSYALLLGWFSRGWKLLPEISPTPNVESLVFVSVIIPFRNELPNLPRLMQCLDRQSYSFHHLEVIFSNDGSTDDGPAWIEKQRADRPWLKMVSTGGKGKKEALNTGICCSTGELILTTDADCRLGKNWIKRITEAYLDQNPDLIVAPVIMEGGHALSSEFQKMDYLALQMFTAGAIGKNTPMICSGANLAFRKAAYFSVSRFMSGKKFLSGDDVFLLHAMKKAGMKTIYVKSSGALVKTTPAASLKGFLFQRARWGGKSRAYKDKATLGTALLVLLTNTLLVISLFLGFVNLNYFWYWVIAMLVKGFADWNLLKPGKDFFGAHLNVTKFLPFSLFYPFYVVVAAVNALIMPVSWKGRRN